MRISIKKARQTFATVVGAAQGTLGVLAFVFAYFLYINFFGVRESLQVPVEALPLYMLIPIVFGFFSVISGLFLLTEREETLQMEDLRS